MVAVDAAGVAVGVVDKAGVVVAPEVPVEVAEDSRTRDSENVTGNGQPPVDDDELDEVEPEAAAPLFEVDDSETEPTPWTRPSATIVLATADSVAAQPEIWTACVVGADEPVTPAAALASAEGEVACSELKAAFAGITPPI